MNIAKGTYEEFLEHAEATDSVVERRGDVSYAVGYYVMRKCNIAEFNHETEILTLFCV